MFCSESNKFSLGFNTQPPEGGWQDFKDDLCGINGFNTQPPEGGW